MSLEQALKDIVTAAVKDALKDFAPAPAVATEDPPKRRGRASKESAPSVPEPEVAAPTVAEPVASSTPSDPFATVNVTVEEVMDAARALSAATSQQVAVDTLKKATGASNRGELKPEQYLTALTALKAAIPAPDPFGAAPAPVAVAQTAALPASAAAQTEAPSLQDVKSAVEAAQKRTSAEKVKSVVMAHGGRVADPNSPGGYGPSLKAIPVSAYAAVIAAVGALPATK